MKESFWGYLILLFGIFVIVIMMIIRDYQTTNDQDYYIMKEVTQASMIDSIDYAYYREHNDLRIIEEKFAENFLRRFAESMSSNKTYKIELFEISENPPKVSVRVTTATGEYILQQDEGGVDFGVVNILSAILDMKHENVVYNNDYIGESGGTGNGSSEEYFERTYYSVGYTGSTGSKSYTINLGVLPNRITASDVTRVTAEAEVMTLYSDFSKYIEAKQSGEMSSNDFTEDGTVLGNTAETLQKHALKSGNFTPTATGSCDTETCTLRVSVNINNLNGVTPTGTVNLQGGGTATGLYYVPIKIKVKFAYQK